MTNKKKSTKSRKRKTKSRKRKTKSRKRKSKKLIEIEKVKDNYCESKATLTKNAQKELLDLVYNAGKKNKKGKFLHHEIGGLLKIQKQTDNVYIIDTIKKSYITGDKNGTNVPKGKAGFHTHPAGEYERQKVLYAWPSGDDYLAILEKMIIEGCIFHIVATKEGIYVISFSPDLARASKKTMRKILKNKEPLSYKFPLPSVNTSNSTPELYMSKIKNLNLFLVEFVNWNDVEKGKYFTFYYPTIKNKCKI